MVRTLTRNSWGAKTETSITYIRVHTVADVKPVQGVEILHPHFEVYPFADVEPLSKREIFLVVPRIPEVRVQVQCVAYGPSARGTEDGSIKDWRGSTTEVVVIVVPGHIEMGVGKVGTIVACRVEERSAIKTPLHAVNCTGVPL